MSIKDLACNYVVGFYGELIFSPLPARMLVLLAQLDNQKRPGPTAH